MMDLAGFDANNVEPNAPRDPIPAGWYKAVITESLEKPTKAQTGSFLQMTLEIIEGELAGRKTFERLNLNNPNQQAVEIAQRALSSICRAVGVMTPRTSQDLHDKPMMIKVKVTPPRDGYEAGNEISEYAPVEKKAATQASSGGATPPWKK
jgi:hypothetical protein